MQNMPDYAAVMQLIKSPEGQKLIAMLQQTDGAAVSAAMKSAQKGDYSGAKTALSSLLDSPEVRKLLKQLEG